MEERLTAAADTVACRPADYPTVDTEQGFIERNSFNRFEHRGRDLAVSIHLILSSNRCFVQVRFS
jgi:hypothetical protein